MPVITPSDLRCSHSSLLRRLCSCVFEVELVIRRAFVLDVSMFEVQVVWSARRNASTAEEVVQLRVLGLVSPMACFSSSSISLYLNHSLNLSLSVSVSVSLSERCLHSSLLRSLCSCVFQVYSQCYAVLIVLALLACSRALKSQKRVGAHAFRKRKCQDTIYIYIYIYINICNEHSAICYTYYMCPHTSIYITHTIYVSAYYYITHTIYVSSYYYAFNNAHS